MCIYVITCLYTYMYIHICIYIYLCEYVSTYTYIYIDMHPLSQDALHSFTRLRMAVKVSGVNKCYDAPLQSVSAALAGTVRETIQEGMHEAALFGGTRLHSLRQGTTGEVTSWKRLRGPRGVRAGAHAGCRASKTCGVLGH